MDQCFHITAVDFHLYSTAGFWLQHKGKLLYCQDSLYQKVNDYVSMAGS